MSSDEGKPAQLAEQPASKCTTTTADPEGTATPAVQAEAPLIAREAPDEAFALNYDAFYNSSKMSISSALHKQFILNNYLKLRHHIVKVLCGHSSKRSITVRCFNRKQKEIFALDPFLIFLGVEGMEQQILVLLLGVVVLLIDISISYKAVLSILFAYCWLLHWESTKLPLRYVHPQYCHQCNQQHQMEDDTQHVLSLLQPPGQLIDVMVSRCEFFIVHAMQQQQQEEHDSGTPSRVLFQLIVVYGKHRWDVWRTYEDFYEVFVSLTGQYPGRIVPKMPSLRRLKKLHRKELTYQQQSHSVSSNSNAGAALERASITALSAVGGSEQHNAANSDTATGGTVTGGVASLTTQSDDGAVSEDAGHNERSGASQVTPTQEILDENDPEFFRLPFLQKLQGILLHWISVIRTDMLLSEDNKVRDLLLLPPPSLCGEPVNGSIGGTIGKHRSLHLSAATAAAASAAAVAAGRDSSSSGSKTSGLATAMTRSAASEKFRGGIRALQAGAAFLFNSPHKEGAPRTNDSIISDTSTGDTSTPAEAVGIDRKTHEEKGTESEAPKIFVSPKGTWEGTCQADFRWLDQTPEQAGKYGNINYTHNFKVRGQGYLHDRQKVEAGNAIASFHLQENFVVNCDKYGDRLDHLARIGRAKRRIEIMSNLPDKPFVLLLNLQVPGDPPMSMVTYYTLPTNFYPFDEEKTPPEWHKASKMFQRFIDIPVSGEFADNKDIGSNENGAAAAPVAPEPDVVPIVQAVGVANVDVRNGDSSVKGATIGSASQAENTIISDATNVQPPSAPVVSPYFTKPAPKSWASDIVWPEAGEYGVLERSGFQNKALKLIPYMVEAPWIVQTAVGSKPVILGQKIVLRYFRGQNYLEIDAHIGSSNIADNVVALCRQYSKTFICNIGLVLEGHSEEELPERLLAAFQMRYPDMDVNVSIDEFDL